MFQVKPHPPKTSLWWYNQRGKINMAPTYQRGGKLWSEDKRACLIDSILNDYDVPKIYLADFNYVSTARNLAALDTIIQPDTPIEDGVWYAVIDGKQRLEAIFEFFDGPLKLSKEFKYYNEPSLPVGGLSYLDLKLEYPKIAVKFEEWIPAVMSVITDEEEKIDEMFVRLNSGLEINRAERRNAMPGVVPRLIRHLVAQPFFIERISFDTKRMQQYNVAAKLLLIEYRGKFVDTKAGNLDRFVKEGIGVETRGFEQAAKRVAKELREMNSVFKKRDYLLRNNGPIPLHYWLIKNHHSERGRLRDFLVEFVKALKQNLDLNKEHPDESDPELNNYYTMQRTTNDQASLLGRYKILEKRLTKFLRR